MTPLQDQEVEKRIKTEHYAHIVHELKVLKLALIAVVVVVIGSAVAVYCCSINFQGVNKFLLFVNIFILCFFGRGLCKGLKALKQYQNAKSDAFIDCL